MSVAARTAQPATIAGPVGELEALVSRPSGPVAATALVCHPHPLHQGTMHNKVVFALARAFERADAVTARFNFRGVGRSTGSYAGGDGEVEDALAVARWLDEHWPGVPRYAAGFSFGAMVALRVADTLRVRGLVTVAPPAARLVAAQVPAPDCPWLLIQGDQDTVTPMSDLDRWLRALEKAPRREVISGADHFFHGRLTAITAVVEAFLQDLEDPRG
jgi:uncharacterized protein